VVDIVLKFDLAMGDNDYLLLGDIDLGNPEHQAQDSLDSHKHLDAVRKVNIVDKRLLEAVNILVDQNVYEDPWDLACWSLGSYPIGFYIAYREI
jgi:hypothetical protein